MDDMIYRNNSIAEENIDPNGPTEGINIKKKSQDVAERTDLGYKDEKVKSAQKRKKLIKEMDKVIKEDLK